ELLASYEAPPASPDFVARTLDALRDTSPAPRGPHALPPASRLPRLLPWVAAAAAAVAAILLLVGGRDPAPRREVFTVQDFSPAVLSTGFDRATAGAHAGLRCAPADPLLQLA